MRHRRRGRKLGRNPKHQRALLRSLACALILTERNAEGEPNKPKVRGRIITTLSKAKEVRPFLEHCISIAKRALPAQEAADRLEPDAEKFTDVWRRWRQSESWYQWCRTVAPAVAARRRLLSLLGSKPAVRILFEDIAPRYADRPGGYVRILRLPTRRLGDAGPRAILEFVGVHDRLKSRPTKPVFDFQNEPQPAASPSS